MKLNKISATGLKVRSFQTNLNPVTIITGPNYRGKSSRLEAIRLGLIGYVPEIGVKATPMLANGTAMSVVLETSDGKCNARSWTKNGKGWKTSEKVQVEVPPVLMDSNVYFSLGPKDAMRYVFAMAQLDEDGMIRRILSDVKAIRLDPPTPAAEAVIKTLVNDIDASDSQRHEDGTQVQLWVAMLIDELRAKLRAAQDSIKSMTGLAKTMIQLGDGDVITRDKSDLIADAESDLKKVQEGAETVRQLIEKRKMLESSVAMYAKSEAEYSEAVTKLKAMDSTPTEPTPDLNAINREINKMSDTLAEARVSLRVHVKRVEEIEADIARIANLKCCPVCKTSHGDWRKEMVKTCNDSLKVEHSEIMELENTISDTAPRLDAKRQEFKTASEVCAQSDCKRFERNSVESTVNRLRAFLDNVKANQEQLDGMEPMEDLLAGADAASKEVLHHTEKLRQLRQEQDAFVRMQQDQRRQAQAQAELEKTQVEADVLKAAIKAIEDIQADVSNKVLGGLCSRANELAGGILGCELFMQDGEVCITRDGSVVHPATLSGTERAIIYAALSIALANESPIKIVLMDEMGRMDMEHKTAFVRRMIELVKTGTIDQFVGVDTASEPYIGIDGVKVVAV